jgi:23S rRNA pseudouridine2605 synthase
MKTYLARIQGEISKDALQKLREGVWLDERKTARADVRIHKSGSSQTELLIGIHEGRNRQVRRMLSAAGHEVQYLRRVRFGPLSLGPLQRGEWRKLTAEEVNSLKRCC